MKTYRVIDLRPEQALELAMQADSPEGAARAILGIDVVRGGNKRSLVAKVYSESTGGLSMVRLYARADDRSSAPT